jgi:phosphate transport system permease protein
VTATLDAGPDPSGLTSVPGVSKRGDRVFGGLSKGAGILILVTLAAVAAFLIKEAIPTFTNETDKPFPQYVGPLIFGTIWAAFLALVVATPLAVAVALFTSHYAPRRLAQTLGWFIDLLAAVPSVVYGLWGSSVFAPVLAKNVYPWLEDNLGFIPLFKGPAASSGRTMMTVALVLAVMILPIITAVTREVFIQTPRGHIEAALALGATRWEVVKTTVLPFGLSGYISGAMLGLGRALGETIALLIILRGTQQAFGWSLFDAGYTFASKIAAAASEFNDQYKAGAYIAAGLILFILTFIVNSLARAAVAGRSKS